MTFYLPDWEKKLHYSEMISQLLFGENLEILEVKENWTLVKCLYDKYEGWMDTKHYVLVEKPNALNFLSFHLSHSAQLNDNPIPLVLGSKLPNFDGLNFKISKQKYLYSGKVIDITQNPLSNLKKIALKYINAPYLWGGRSPFGIDCSGYTQMVYNFFNICR